MTTQTIRPALPRRSESDARHHAINTAAGVLAAAQQTGAQTPTGLAFALDCAGLLNSPEHAAEFERMRERLAEYERPADEDPIAYALTDQADGHLGQALRETQDCTCIHPPEIDNGHTLHASYCVSADAMQASVTRLRPPLAEAPAPPDRVSRLLDAIRTHRGEWTTRKVMEVYRAFNIPAPKRSTARSDLRLLHAMGHLAVTEDKGRRFYTLKTRAQRGLKGGTA
ncbi:hypothetical protein [Streptomyces griseoluteus]|uniref:hypothetical protein n=1 Tax=Streptomyces griseoluteus TaxID=29306 RepID=UPI00365742A5